MLIHCDGWRGGSSDVGNPAPFAVGDADDFSLGGVFAGASAVHRSFLRACALPAQCLDEPFGMSLWSPGDSWLKPESDRRLHIIPTRYWMLGLGHLGQAYLWNLLLLPHPCRAEVEFLLNDFDSIDESNHGSCLLLNANSVGQKKTRFCVGELEKLGFRTVIEERAFGAQTFRSPDEPAIALCGFDNAEPRRFLDRANFDLVYECGLGGSLGNFDQAELHSFPNEHRADKIWGTQNNQPAAISQETIALFETAKEECGQIAIDMAGKAGSTSFVGAMCGSLLTGEILRTFNRGVRHEQATFNARCLGDWIAKPTTDSISASKLGAMGYASVP